MKRNSLIQKLVATIYSTQNDNSPAYTNIKNGNNFNTTKKILTNSPPKDNNDFNRTYQKEKRQSKKQLSMQDPKKTQFLSQNMHLNSQDKTMFEGGNEYSER